MTAKGEHQSPQLGSKNGNAKLDEQDVEIIRFRMEKKRQSIAEIDAQIEALIIQKNSLQKSDSIKQLSLDFEVAESTIKNVLYNRAIWGHVK
jgi:hypothetical protein